VKVGICRRCNNETFSGVENAVARVFAAPDPFAASAALSPDFVAIWLAKIVWLLARKGNASIDHRTRNDPQPSPIVDSELIDGLLYAGMFLRTFATGKGMASCYRDDPPIPEYFYGAPFSLYAFEIDTRDTRFEAYDFLDNLFIGAAALRSGNLGFVCLFDGGLHRRFRAHAFDYLVGRKLHPMQFAEVVGLMYYDQTVVEPEANKLTYYWNKPLNAVVAQMWTPRAFNPYLQERHDPARLAQMLAFYTMHDPASLLGADGAIFTSLRDVDGAFLPFAVTDDEMRDSMRREGAIKMGPIDPAVRTRLAREDPAEPT
jgi:hypothetical protein